MAGFAKAVTPSNTATLAQPGWIYVGGAGNLAVITERGDAITFVGVAKGTVLNVLVKQVKVTGTTATNLIVVY